MAAWATRQRRWATALLSTTLLRARYTERVREISLLALLVQKCFLQRSFAQGSQRESERSVYLLYLYKTAFYKAPSRQVHRESQRDQFTCFSCTKVQILTLISLIPRSFAQGIRYSGCLQWYTIKMSNTDANFAQAKAQKLLVGSFNVDSRHKGFREAGIGNQAIHKELPLAYR